MRKAVAKRSAVLLALLFAAAGYVYLQTTPPAAKLATLMPGGALLYLEAPDFGRLLRDWDSSLVKADWLESANFDVFSRSNLFTKLAEVYGQYGEAAGLAPDLKTIVEIAGTDSALALYEIRDVEFLYISRIAAPDLMKSQLWAVRDKFEQRQAGGVPFYLRTDPASKRTVAFAFTQGYLLFSTRDDLLAQALALVAGGANPSIATDRWYQDTVGRPAGPAPAPGELRLVMNLESLARSVYFRSYWVQRNVSQVRRYWAGVADVKRSGNSITESRVFLRAPEAPEPVTTPVSRLLPLVPPEAGMYKAWSIGESSDAAAVIVEKLIAPQPQRARDWRQAPDAVYPDNHAGAEGDLETRIDEQPLPVDAGVAGALSAVRAMVEKAGTRSLLLVQASSPAAGTFIQTPSVIVLDGGADWDRDSVRSSLTAAAGGLWSTSQLGAGWVAGAVETLDGLGTLQFTNRGHLLFLANDARLLAAVLARAGTAQAANAFTYAAGFRHLRERPNFERVMTALDFSSPNNAPAFFSVNIASLGRVLSGVAEVRMTEEQRGPATRQTVVYQLAP